MRVKVLLRAVMLGVGMAFLSAATASAANINLSRSSVPIGGTVTVSGDVLAANGQPGCTVPGTVTLISGAFAGQGSFQNQDVEAPVGADGKYSVKARILPGVQPNTYTITGRCGGGNLGVQATLVVTPALPATGREPLSEAQASLPLDGFPFAGTLGAELTIALLAAALLASGFASWKLLQRR